MADATLAGKDIKFLHNPLAEQQNSLLSEASKNWVFMGKLMKDCVYGF